MTMESSSIELDQSFCENIDTNLNGDGSNAIILPQTKKKKNKGKGAGKASGIGKAKEPQKMSKSKQRKLKQIQEEKEKRLLLSKSIDVLQKHKIWDGAYSLLKCSGTIGQTDTMREKRRRAVEFSKAGLEVPEEVSLFKRKKKDKAFEEGAVELNGNQSHFEHFQNYSQLMSTRSASKEVGSQIVQSSLQVTNCNTDICMREGEKRPSASCNSDERPDTNPQGLQPGASDMVHPNNGLAGDVLLKEHLTAPIIVHVSRPKEVEETRRDLPIVMMEQEIMEAINEHPVVIICGETGCGKTTQVPQFLYEAGFGSKGHRDRKGMIGVTQPRRVAVLATAKRVAFELGLHLGTEVGFQVRHDKMIGNSCSIKFMTDGILLREVQSDFLLKKYSVLILDEAHERSLNTDVLIGMLSRVVRLRQKLYMEQQEKLLSGVKINPENIITRLRLVLMSATLRVEDFVSDRKLFSETPPVLEVAVRQYPVTVHFSKNTKVDYLGLAFKKVMSIHNTLPPGGILVFVTGQREVEFLCKRLRKASEKLTKTSSKLENESDLASDVDMKEINEACEVEGSSPYRRTDKFSDDENPHDTEMDCYSSDSELESGSEAEDEDVMEIEGSNNSGSAIDFLEDAESLSSLKAAFEALAGNVSEPNSKKNTSLPVVSATQGHPETSVGSIGAMHVLPLYAMLPANAQLRVFADVPEGERLVVVATNVAETSLTIPGIKYVVDTGKEKVKNYKYTSGMAAYEVQWISKASSAQRAGRAGRTGPGHCYRLYSSAAFGKDDVFPDFSCPEISKIPVDGVVLLLKSMGIDKVVNFPFPTPPKIEALVEAEKCLTALNALDPQGRLTRIGKAMGQYPMSPRHSRMLLTFVEIMRSQPGYSRADLLLAYAVAVAAALSVSNPFIMQYEVVSDTSDAKHQEEKKHEKPDTEKMKEKTEKQVRKKEKAAARDARSRFCNPSSDALTVAHALQLFELADDRISFCKTNTLHLKTMEEMSKLRKQLLQLVFYQSKVCVEFSWNNGKIDDVELSWRKYPEKQPLLMNEEKLLGQAICAGWADRVAKRIRAVSNSIDKYQKVHAPQYQSCALKDTVFLHRWSSTSQSAPEFVVYTELLCSKRPYMHGVTAVNADWLVKYASPLCTFSTPLTDPKPYYDPQIDQVLCWVSPTFGPHDWQLPLHCLPINNDALRVSVFALALLEGNVLPCLKPAHKFLAASPSIILRPEALGQRRVGDLLNGLKIGSRTIDSRAMLRQIWSEKPRFLYAEIQQWFQEKIHDCFAEIWEKMLEEVKLERHELFPRKIKKKIKKH
ncbi:putative RNA helicase [Dioscorea sansibarensis]